VSPLAVREALVATLLRALSAPDSLGRADHDLVSSALSFEPPAQLPDRQEADVEGTAREGGLHVALDTLAAILYSRPDLIHPALLDRLAALVRAETLPPALRVAVDTIFQVLAASDIAPRAWTALNNVLLDPSLGPAVRARLLALVEPFVQWREDLVGLDGILALAEVSPLASHRALLLDDGIERFAFCVPEAFTEERLRRLHALFGEVPRYRYLLYTLAARRHLGPAERAALASWLRGRFPAQATAGAVLRPRPMRVLVVLNVGQGQGDDVVRLAPLLQGLLDANPGLTITLATWRPYLYDNPRVTAISIKDDAAVAAALRAPYEGIVEFFQPEWPRFTFRGDLHASIERVRLEHPPAFAIEGDLGRACEGRPGERSPFLYQRVEIAGRDIAQVRGLDQKVHRSTYEPALRLLAELGLPQRVADEPSTTPSVLTGAPSADAERVWARLRASGPGRPVALVNPFGGSGPTKGFLAQGTLLAAELTALVEEGYRVVLVPNGTAWGGPAAVDDALALLAGHARVHVAVAPDPKEADEAGRLALHERADLPYADRVMRLFKYFTAYADLVVTVEGWMAHFAYIHGRPFRLFVAAGSFSSDWYPHGRSREQRLVTALSPHARAQHDAIGLLRERDPAPLPHRPRKELLGLAVGGLGRAGGPEAVALLRRVLASPDPDVREWAVAALGRCETASVKAALLAALDDPAPGVVREAADALLRSSVDCARELGSRYREQLQLHADLARGRWDTVRAAGSAALPALFRGAKSDHRDTRREAKSLLRELVAPYVPQLDSDQRADLTQPLAER
jgi:hypothetical protein